MTLTAGNGGHRLSALAVATALLGCSGALAACGASPSSTLAGKSPQEILQAAATTLKSQTSFHVAGSGTSTGSAGTQRLGLAMDVFRSGDLSGQLTDNHQTIKILSVHRQVYFYASSAGWMALNLPAQLAGRLGGHWVRLPGSMAQTMLSLSFGQLTQQLTSPGKVTYAKSGTSTVDGRQVVGVSYKKASETYTFYVADTGPSYIVRVTQRGTTNSSVDIGGWNQQAVPAAPSNPIVLPGA